MPITLGVDPSSSITGLAIARDQDLLYVDVFRADRAKPISANMLAFQRELVTIGEMFGRIDILVVEKVSVQWNVDTIRKIAYFEAVAMVWGAGIGSDVQQVQATRARKIVFGKGSTKKEQAWELMTERFPSMPWDKKNDGGMDETDASCLALAGPALVKSL